MSNLIGQLSKVVTKTAAGVNRAIVLEAGDIARFSDGACICSLGNSSVLVTTVARPSTKVLGYLPLTVDYRQKAAAFGRIPMTHLRRDIGVTEKETLTGRMIDRSIRPAFIKGFNSDTQVICNVVAVDGHNDPDVLAINGASASIALSDIPWNGPIGAVRVGLVQDKLVPNPSRREQEESSINLVLSANKLGNIMMIDGSCKEPVKITKIQKAIKFAVKEAQAVVESIIRLQDMNGKSKKAIENVVMPTEAQKDLALSQIQQKIKSILTNSCHDKDSRGEAMSAVREELTAALREVYPEIDPSVIDQCFIYVVKSTYHRILTKTSIRCDGRKFEQLRPISCAIDVFKPLHGSSQFQRGQTKVLCSTTFDSPDAAFRNDPMTFLTSGVQEKNFMLHYEFPPFATHDIGKVAVMPGRREIGHGALAEKAIRPLVPESQDMTIRLNCEVLESNGSSSMASVCAGSLSLMDAGVDLEEHVAGVAIGLMSNRSDNLDHEYAINAHEDEDHILTDILGFEDFIGDMDFKIAGTKKAITALQLDVKPTLGLPQSIVDSAIRRSHNARTAIIAEMERAISEPRKEKKDNHPIIKTIYVPPYKRSRLIGFGGVNIKKLTAQIGVRVAPYESDDSGDGTSGATKSQDNFIIFAPNRDAMAEAEEFISTILDKNFKEPELEFNGIYTATIQELRDNGVMVTLYPEMTPTMLHVSQLDVKAVKHPSALNLDVGQEIQVKYFGRDPATGQMRLSRKSLQMTSTARVHRTPSA